MNASLFVSHSMTLLAQATQVAASATSQPTATPPGWAKFITSSGPLLPIAIGFLLLMMFTSRSKKQKESSREAMLKLLKRGDRIQTIGGIQGTVMRAEETRVEVKVDESSNAKIWFARTAIYKVMDDEKADAAK